MLKHSGNRQAIHSLDALSKALFDLMQDDSFEKITITQICQTAQISRRTFYRHCSRKLDLIDYLIQKQIRELLESVDFTCADPVVLYHNFFRYWQNRSVLLTLLYRSHLFPHFSQVFTKCCLLWMEDRLMRDMLKDHSNQDSLRLFYNSFLIGGLCNVLELWTAEDFKTSVQDLTYVLVTLAPDK